MDAVCMKKLLPFVYSISIEKAAVATSVITCLLIGSTVAITTAQDPATIGAGVTATVGAINAVAPYVAAGSRSVILEVGNGSNVTLRAASYRNSHGGFGINPRGEIPPNTWNVFGAKSTGVLTGTEGTVTYAGDGFNFKIYWDNPYAGANKCNATLSGPNADSYRVFYACGRGNKNARMTYQLFRR